MIEFWEENFKDKQTMWGDEPSPSALFARDYFLAQNVKDVLIPGVGYGRNTKPFLEAGMSVTGVEISQTAIDLAKEKLGLNIPIYHGSISDMPFDDKSYDGIFCYCVIHLLDEDSRTKLIKDCYSQLQLGASMIFTAISKNSSSYGKGEKISDDRFEQHKGVQIFFYNEESIKSEFGQHGLVKFHEVEEPGGMKFYNIVCQK